MEKMKSTDSVMGTSVPTQLREETSGARKKGLALIAKVDVRPI